MHRAHALLMLLAACAEDPTPREEDACGDGTRGEFEMCDDGNTISGDGCSARCVSEPSVTVYWHFYATFPAASSSDELDCRPGVEMVELISSINTTRTFPCIARYGAIPVPLGERVLARLLAADGTAIAESLPAIPNTLAHVSADFYEHAGYVRTWFEKDLCPPGAIEAWLTPVDGGTPFYSATSCPQSPLVGIAPAGTYDLTIKTPRLEHTITNVTVLANNGVSDVELR